jgi:membrane protein YdbS with pleckstrin-like domain
MADGRDDPDFKVDGSSGREHVGGEPSPGGVTAEAHPSSERSSPRREYGPQPTSGHRPAETLPEELLEYTTERRSLSPRVRILWTVRTGAVALLFGIIAGLFATNAGASPAITGVFVLVFLFAGLVWVLARYRVWIYQIRRDALYLERGVFRHVRTLVPFVRIQHVDTSRGPLERALGLSTLVVYTAGSRGADVSVPGLTPEEARDLQQRVKELAIQAEGGDAV